MTRSRGAAVGETSTADRYDVKGAPPEVAGGRRGRARSAGPDRPRRAAPHRSDDLINLESVARRRTGNGSVAERGCEQTVHSGQRNDASARMVRISSVVKVNSPRTAWRVERTLNWFAVPGAVYLCSIPFSAHEASLGVPPLRQQQMADFMGDHVRKHRAAENTLRAREIFDPSEEHVHEGSTRFHASAAPITCGLSCP